MMRLAVSALSSYIPPPGAPAFRFSVFVQPLLLQQGEKNPLSSSALRQGKYSLPFLHPWQTVTNQWTFFASEAR